MAVQVVEFLMNNVENKGTASKLIMLFGGFEPIIANSALVQLPRVNTDFYGIPDYGSSIVFELFSTAFDSTTNYPDPDDLRCGFSFPTALTLRQN